MLAESPRPVEELPGDTRALRIVSQILRHLGLLVGDESALTLSPIAQRLLRDGVLPNMRMMDYLSDHARIAEVLRNGGPVPDGEGGTKVTDGGVRRDSPEKTAAFLDMLYDRAGEASELTYQHMEPHLPSRARVLDVGGGHGRYARRFADAGHDVTIFDFPMVVEYSRTRHADNLSYIEGNFRDTQDFGQPYDLILLSNIVHGEPEEMNRELLKKLAGHLTDNGSLVIKDMLLDEVGTNPESAVFFALSMLFYTRAGDSPRRSQVREWLQGAGLSDVEIVPFSDFELVRGTRRPRGHR